MRKKKAIIYQAFTIPNTVIDLSVDQWFSNLRVCQNHLESWWKPKITGPHPQSFWPKWGLRICISNIFPGEADAAGPGTTLRRSLV